ncbi:MAG: hypothetical protein JXR49_16700, partial [Acidobacteria bacterium]|nr:hypothetical protein [Acidobacteriota bacterium]
MSSVNSRTGSGEEDFGAREYPVPSRLDFQKVRIDPCNGMPAVYTELLLTGSALMENGRTVT